MVLMCKIENLHNKPGRTKHWHCSFHRPCYQVRYVYSYNDIPMSSVEGIGRLMGHYGDNIYIMLFDEYSKKNELT